MTTEIEEREANYFAMCFLMPEEWLLADVAKMGGIDILDDDVMANLAKRYRVNMALMALRLAQIGALKKSATAEHE